MLLIILNLKADYFHKILIRNDEIKKFDKEYATQYTPEMKYLESVGIKYKFVKILNEVNTYKYTKSPELFHALEIFYAQK
jgi:hypothetical protein